MLSKLISQSGRTLTTIPKFTFIDPPKHSETHHHVTLR